MGWIQALVEFFQLSKLILGWWQESSAVKSKEKREVLTKAMEAADHGDQEAMRRAINSFNSI